MKFLLESCRGNGLILLLLTCLLLSGTNAAAFSPDQDCLWVAYGERIRAGNNQALIPVKINFGRFPDTEKGLSSLSNLQAFYYVNNGDGRSGWRRYRLDLNSRDREGFVRINTHEHDHLIIAAMAELGAAGHRTSYFAKSTFNRFTRKMPSEPIGVDSELSDLLRLDILPLFHYWRQTGSWLNINVRNPPAARSAEYLFVLDEHLAAQKVTLDNAGAASILFPDDRILNQQSSKASKTTLLVTETDSGNRRYLSTFSLQLHRSRTMHRNHPAGLATFGVAVALALGTVLWKRRKTGF